MDDTYRGVYAALYASRTSEAFRAFPTTEWGPVDRDLLQTPVRQAIESAEVQLQPRFRLRDDAKALLAVDFQDLVMLPLLAGGRIPFAELRNDVATDIGLLASSAADQTPRGEVEVSGHRIIDALSRNWSKLRIARYGLWEEDAT